jgi:hypothetical protein
MQCESGVEEGNTEQYRRGEEPEPCSTVHEGNRGK